VIDPDRLTWVEQLVFDLDRGTATTRLVPDHYPDRLTCTGVYTFRASRHGAEMSVRRLEGDLKVRVPLVGGRVENALVNGLQQHARAEQDLIAGRLADKPGKPDKPDGKKSKSDGKKSGKKAGSGKKPGRKTSGTKR
jgi:hypothetical protein